MGRKNEFIKNTAILFIGKFATQFMSLLLLPLFTHFLLSKDYGMVDLLQTYITLFIPIFTLRIDSAVFRFLIDKRNDDEGKTLIITNVLLILLLGVITVSIISVMILFLVKIKYLQYVIFNIIALMMSNILLQVLRGLGKNKEYSICSIITGTVTLISNVTLIIIFKVGAESILISSTIANIVCILTVVKIVDIVKYIKLSKIDKKICKEILKYSVPMIPNALSWWIVNVSDRTIISTFLGTAANRYIYSFL